MLSNARPRKCKRTNAAKGSRKSTKARMHALLERDAEALTRKVIEKALAGDLACLRLCIERLYPPYKPTAVPIEHDDVQRNRVIKLNIFDDTGTTVDVNERRGVRDEL